MAPMPNYVHHLLPPFQQAEQRYCHTPNVVLTAEPKIRTEATPYFQQRLLQYVPKLRPTPCTTYAVAGVCRGRGQEISQARPPSNRPGANKIRNVTVTPQCYRQHARRPHRQRHVANNSSARDHEQHQNKCSTMPKRHRMPSKEQRGWDRGR